MTKCPATHYFEAEGGARKKCWAALPAFRGSPLVAGRNLGKQHTGTEKEAFADQRCESAAWPLGETSAQQSSPFSDYPTQDTPPWVRTQRCSWRCSLCGWCARWPQLNPVLSPGFSSPIRKWGAEEAVLHLLCLGVWSVQQALCGEDSQPTAAPVLQEGLGGDVAVQLSCCPSGRLRPQQPYQHV